MADTTPITAASDIGKSVTYTDENGDIIQTVEGGANPGKYSIKVIRTKCIGAGPCVAVAPKIMELSQENIAVVLSQDELDEIKLLAAQSCPTAAIIIDNVETGERVWPM